MRDSVVFYRSFYEAMKELPETDQAAIYNALFAYALDGEEPQLAGVQSAIFKLMRPSIDSNNQKYENGCKGAEFGKLGGRPPKKPQENPKETPKKPQENPKETPYEYEDEYEDVDEDVYEAESGDGAVDESEDGDEDGDSFLLADGSSFRLPPARLEEFIKTFPELNVRAELLRCRLKHNALRQRRNVLTIEQYIVNWLINAQADAKKKPPSARSGTFSDIPQRDPVDNAKLMKELAAKAGNLI